jgi:hypothetical protein
MPGNRLPQRILEVGNKRHTKEAKTPRKMDVIRLSMTKHGLPEQDIGDGYVVLRRKSTAEVINHLYT